MFKRHKKFIFCVAATIAGVAAFYTLLSFIFPLPMDRLFPPSATVVKDRDGNIVRIFLPQDDKFRITCSLQEVSPHIPTAIIAYEDKRFYSHPCIDPVAVFRALKQNFSTGKVVSGASTITMQVARLIEPKERTMASKLVELFRAIQLELRFTKDEILERYINLAPYGGNIEGICSASFFYFGKEASQMSLGESALLAAIPNSPEKKRPVRQPENAGRGRHKVLKALLREKAIAASDFEKADSEPIPKMAKQIPFAMPHAALKAKDNAPARAILRLTISPSVQKIAEQLLENRLKVLSSYGIKQGAIVVIDNDSSEVLAYIGSRNFFDDVAEGQVDGAFAPRSPGSALKPFVYALALDRGLVTPLQLLPDLPVNYGSYAPDNFDGRFRGYVSMKEALLLSLNVPAVTTLASLGLEGLYPLLKRANFTSLNKPERDYGLSMVLGGVEVRLVELTNLYSALARGGLFRPYRILSDESQGVEVRLFSEASAYIISETLSEREKTTTPNIPDPALYGVKIAWKTGTSYGHKDAWCLGYNKKYTVGVWFGNFNGKGAPELVGSVVAMPLLADLFTNLPKANVPWFEMPPSVGVRKVCPLSGALPAPACPQETVTDFYIKEVSPSNECGVHQEIMVDDKTGARLCPSCKVGRKYHQESYVIWPPSVAGFLAEEGFPIKRPPRHSPNCSAAVEGIPPIIRSPVAQAEYVLRAGVPVEYQKIKLAGSAEGDANTIYWFVDDKLIWSGPPGKDVFILPEIGTHSLVLADDLGRSSKTVFSVKNFLSALSGQ